MRGRTPATSRWILDGIPADGDLVRLVEEVATREGKAVPAWVEGWLLAVLSSHYGRSIRGMATATRLDPSIAVTMARTGRERISDRPSRAPESAGRAHRRKDRAPDELHTFEIELPTGERGTTIPRGAAGMPDERAGQTDEPPAVPP